MPSTVLSRDARACHHVHSPRLSSLKLPSASSGTSGAGLMLQMGKVRHEAQRCWACLRAPPTAKPRPHPAPPIQPGPALGPACARRTRGVVWGAAHPAVLSQLCVWPPCEAALLRFTLYFLGAAQWTLEVDTAQLHGPGPQRVRSSETGSP